MCVCIVILCMCACVRVYMYERLRCYVYCVDREYEIFFIPHRRSVAVVNVTVYKNLYKCRLCVTFCNVLLFMGVAEIGCEDGDWILLA